jgi:hypothetical protein
VTSAIDLSGLSVGLGTIQRGASIVGADLGEAWDRLVEALNNPGSPGALADAADAWVEQVKSKVNGSRNDLAEHAKTVTSVWEGPAASAFQQFLTNLDACYLTMGQMCDSIAKGLRDTKTALIIFWGAMVVFAIAAAGLIITCIVALIPSFGASSAGIVAAIIAFIGATVTAIIAIENFYNTLRDSYSAMHNQLAQQPGFPKGKWPRPGIPVGDGDPAHGDWHVKGG